MSVVEDPRILASSTLRGIDDQRAATQRYARQSAGDNGHLFPEEHIGAEIHVPRLHLPINEAWGPGEHDGGLGDVIAWIGVDAIPEIVALLGRAVGPDQHPVTTGFANRLHHIFVEIAADVFALQLV